jgi:hypothetical protein
MFIEAFIVCPVVAFIVLLLAIRRIAPEYRRVVVLAWSAHLVMAFVNVAYHEYYYLGGDMYFYASDGILLAREMRWDPYTTIPQVLRLALHLENDLRVTVVLPGTNTATISCFTGMLMFFVGETMYGVALLVSVFSFHGSLRLYGALEWALSPAERKPILLGILLVPSVLFWGSGVVKEAFVIGFFGIACASLADLIRHRRITAVLGAVFGLYGMAVVKPYVLLPLMLGIAGWIYAGRGKKLGLLYKVLAVGVAIAGVLALTQLFPEYSPDKLGTSVAQEQQKYRFAEAGGSDTKIGGNMDADAEGRSLLSHIGSVPLALVNALLRPMFFDVHNFATLMAAVEMTYLLYLLVTVTRRHGLRTVIQTIANRPQYLSAAAFILPFALAVGLATRNLGTLSRYRVPAMPLMFFLVLGLRAHLDDLRDRVVARQGAPVTGSLPPRKTDRFGRPLPGRRARLDAKEQIRRRRAARRVG